VSASQSEAEIVRAILKAVRARGYFAFRIHGGPFTAPGLPDVFVFRGGQCWALEVKRPGGKASKVQLAVIGSLRAAGIRAEVVYGVSDALGIIGERERKNAKSQSEGGR